jgi:hypothetical protein
MKPFSLFIIIMYIVFSILKLRFTNRSNRLITTGYTKRWHFCTCRMSHGIIASTAKTKAACSDLSWKLPVEGSFWLCKYKYIHYCIPIQLY